MDKFWQILDRTMVLFIGMGVGAIMALAFMNNGSPLADPAVASTSPAAAPAAASADETGGQKLANARPVAAGKCARGVQVTPRIMDAIRNNRTVQVGVFGDSFGDGLWAGLYNKLRSDDNFKVHRFSKQSTGFTRYQSLNLYDDIRSKIIEQPVDVAVISFGANDTQGIYADGKLAPYMSDAWKAKIAERTRKVITLFQSRGVMVTWVGLPRMRDAKYDGDIQQMNEFFAGVMCDMDVPFIDTVPLTIDKQGQYALFLKDPATGEEQKARAGDGKHMTMSGYGFLIHDFTQDLKRMLPPRPAEGKGGKGGKGDKDSGASKSGDKGSRDQERG